MTGSEIHYDQRVQTALRGVVRDVLRDVSETGLPGEHHFYVAFRTQAPGVDIPDHLVARYPEEMTIVIQHKFWGLKVEEDSFEIGLSFNQQPTILTIPFEAIVGFVDPSVQFALQFQNEAIEGDDEDDDGVSGYADEEDETIIITTPSDYESGSKDSAGSNADDGSGEDTAEEKSSDGNNVVTLDAFRKK